MVQRLGSGSIFVGVLNFRIGDESADQSLQMRIAEALDKIFYGLPQLADIFGGAGQLVRIINL